MATKYIVAIRRSHTGAIALLKLSDWNIETREQVIANIEALKDVYYTRNAQQQTARVEVVTIRGKKFLKTVADNTEADNLGNLPEF